MSALPTEVDLPGSEPLQEIANAYLRARLARREISVQTMTNHRYILRAFVADVGGTTTGVTVEAVERWLEERGNLQGSSRRTHWAVVNVFCGWLARHGYIDRDPTAEMAKPRQPRAVPRALPESTVADLLEVVSRPRDRAMVWLMVGMGLRCCEVARAELADWDRRAATLRVNGKGDVPRVLPVPAAAGRALAAYVEEDREGGLSGLLFRSYRTPRDGLTPHSISRLMGEWLYVSGGKRRARDGVGAHSLRHTAASDVLERSKDLRLVQNMLGHSNISTTSQYLRLASMGQLRDAMEGRTYGDEPEEGER